MRRVLLINDDDRARQTLQVKLRSAGYETVGVSSLEGARRGLIGGDPIHFVLLPAALVKEAARDLPTPILIALLPPGAAATAGLDAMADGAHDFIQDLAGGGDDDDLVGAATLAFRKAEARAVPPPPPGAGAAAPAGGAPERAGRTAPAPAPSLVGDSPAMRELDRTIRKVAPYKATVLVLGESGTGKELIARAVHTLSPRAGAPFVAVNCGAIPAGLMESELLGHCKGAFTDALRDRVGLLEQASGGTLFLDEIAELPLELQVKLLRVLQDERVRRLGDAEERPIDVRLVAATARDLEGEVAAGRFREDLFHRINVVALRVPPLRAREGDIPRLVEHFVTRTNQRLRLSVGGVAREAMQVLVAYGWPGNVRELENTIERAAVMCEGGEIDVASLPERVLNGRNPEVTAAAGGVASAQSETGGDLSIKRAARRAEEDLIRQALVRTGGNRTRAAELLEISHRALLYKIKEYGVFLPMPSSSPTSTPKDPKF